MTGDGMHYLKSIGWNWGFVDQSDKPKPRATHWKYGASKLLIPRITVYHE